MLYGRSEERARIATLLQGARRGHALLQDAAEQADGFRQLRCAGIEAELELPFAGLHQLLGPVLDRLDRLPAPQAQGLQAAFGLVETEATSNRFLVELGVLSLLAVVAGEQPVLCSIAEAGWLDAASA